MNRAALFLILATFLYSLINVAVKFLEHLPATEIVFFRQFLTLGLSAFLLWKAGKSFVGNNKKLLLARGFFGSIALITLFICLQNMPLAVVTTLINLTPIFTVIIAHFYLQEKANLVQWIFLALAFLGAVLMRGGLTPVPWLWMGMGIVTAFFAAITYTVVRQLRTSDDPMVVIFYFPLVTLPMVTPVVVIQWVPPTLWDGALLVGVGLLTLLAQYFMTVAYHLEQASKIMVFNYVSLLWGVLFGFFLFQETMTEKQWMGLAIILFCLCGNYWVTAKAKGNLAFRQKIS